MAYEYSCNEQTNFQTGEVTLVCGDMAKAVSHLDLFILHKGTILRHSDSYTFGPTDGFQHTFTWNAGGEWAGPYELRVVAVAPDGSEHEQSVWVEAVYGGGRCTFNEADAFYSYRRDGVTGRMASLIWLG